LVAQRKERATRERQLKLVDVEKGIKNPRLSVDDLERAEKLILQHEQQKYFKDELRELGVKQKESKGLSKSSNVYKLDPR
jgi:hypothetical protein